MAIMSCTTKVDALGRETVQHGENAFPIGCYHDDLRQAPVPWHWHEELEAAVVTEGETVLHVESQQFHLKAGDGFFINSGYLHACDYLPPAPCRFHSMSFHARLVGGSIDSIFWKKYLQPLLEDPSLKYLVLRPDQGWQRKLLEDIEKTWQAVSAEDEGYELQVRSLLSDVLFRIGKQRLGEDTKASARTLRENSRIKQMLSFMQEHCAEDLTVSQIAESAGISKSEALRVFHSTITMTPIQYLKYLRIQKAAHLLSETDQKIIDIGIECGFQDMSYFSKAFRQAKGSTPSQYRQFARKEKI